jgi:GTP-binding protein LepA
LGTFSPEYVRRSELLTGEVGYIATGLKSVREIQVGDTVTTKANPASEIYPGYKTVKPMVFAGLFPIDGEKFSQLRESLDKLRLSDSALSYEPEASSALGNGFRCGFLGLLHLEIVQERLEREYQLDLITTAPSVAYIAKIRGKQGELEDVQLTSADAFPDPSSLISIAEPWASLTIITPSEYLGAVIDLVTKRRGNLKNTEYLDEKRVTLHFEIPLAEILVDFYNDLKSATSGYASMDYELLEYRDGDLVKLDIMIAEDVVEALGVITPRSRSMALGRSFLQKLKEVIPRQLFQIKLQAAIGAKILARENISAMRKDVTAKLYGGDISRKRKLLEKQKKGKKRMKMIGKVIIPQEAFMAVLTLKS